MSTLAAIRRFLLAILLFGVAGMGTELLLIGHVEGVLQLAPVVLLAAGLLVAAWHAVAPHAATVRVLQATMGLFVLTGTVGIGLHYDGNAEFELEMYPSLSGVELFRKTMTGATPVFAPGTMALLGFVGLAHTYRHPLTRRALQADGP